MHVCIFKYMCICGVCYGNVAQVYMKSVQKVSSHIIWKIETFIEEDTRYKKQCVHGTMIPLSPLQSRHLGTSHNSPNHHQLPTMFSWISTTIWNLFLLPFQRLFSFWEKAEVTGHQIWAVSGLSHLGYLMFNQKTLHKTQHMSGHIVVMKLPISSCP